MGRILKFFKMLVTTWTLCHTCESAENVVLFSSQFKHNLCTYI